jgi:hypothetical protein
LVSFKNVTLPLKNKWYYFFSRLFRREDRKDNRSPKIKAHKKPWMCMPETNLEASKIIRTLMTSRNIPKVIMVIGSVKMIRIGFTRAFKSPSTSTKINAVE